MMTKKLAFLATTALVGNAFGAAGAFAQSTGTSLVDNEVVVVTGNAGPQDVSGIITAETVAKTRTTITQEYIETQAPGQTILQTLNIVTPGLNFTNNDPYGTSGGNIRLHGFDGNRVALTFDGMPLNDTGNYAVFTNQLLDPELISSAQVNTGSTDVDSPTAASSGGTINFASRKPGSDPDIWATASLGDFAYRRYMIFGESGEIGPWDTSGWLAGSYQKYDKFKGAGNLYKRQFNAKIYQPIGEGKDFISVAVHYNVNRNNNYYSPSLSALANPNNAAQPFIPEETATDPTGWNVDFRTIYQPDLVTTATTGDRDLAENAQNGAVRGWYGLRINPSNTGNVRIQSRWDFGDNLTLTVDPSFQYVLANGGTQNTTIFESCNGSVSSTTGLTAYTTAVNTTTSCPVLTRQLLGTVAPSATAGRDINGDGDINDLVRVMNPSNTNTRRLGVLSSLIWRMDDTNLFRASYTWDYGRHRQTGEFSLVDPATHFYLDEFGGKDGHGPKIATVDGQSFMRNRDRFSIAELNQVSLEYRGSFYDDALNVSAGVRAPYFKRELNQYCYSQNGSSNVRCTTEVPNATLANGNVTFAGATTQYIAPYSKKVTYDDILPNVGASWSFGDSQIYGSYAESTSLPRTDNLYTVARLATATTVQPFTNDVVPETSKTIEGGYRFAAGGIVGSLAAWATNFENRIVSAFDQDTASFIDRNVGKVEQYGVDAGFGWQPADEVALYFSASYNESELQDNIPTATTPLPTRGKTLVETPGLTMSARTEYEPIPGLIFGVQGKYVGDRWVTDVNDLKVPSYFLVDMDATWKLDMFGLGNSSVRVNVINMFDENYYGSLGSTNTATQGAVGFGRPFANIGAPRTVTVSLRADY